MSDGSDQTHGSAKRYDVGSVGPATLQAALEQDFPDIQRAISDFLVQRGGLMAASAALRRAMTTLRRHIYVEEEFLFPLLQDAEMAGPLYAMSGEHQDLWLAMDQMEQELRQEGSQEARKQACRILRAEVDRHVTNEDPIVFRYAEETLTSQEQADLRDFVENVTLPSEWRCREPRRP